MTDRIIQGKAGFHSFKLLHLCLVLLNLIFFFKKYCCGGGGKVLILSWSGRLKLPCSAGQNATYL